MRRKTFVAVEVTEHPLMQRPTEEPRSWSDCPLDIMLMVFESLEHGDLVNCLLVNTHWRDAVNYFGLHRGIWKELAQAGMVNKGIDLRRRSNPRLGWRDLYVNYLRWRFVKQADLAWDYELSDNDIRYLHVYKDILILESDEDYFKKYYRINGRLEDVSKKLIDAGEADVDNFQQRASNGHVVGENGDDSQDDAEESGYSEEEEEELSYMSDKMLRKLVTEVPFTRLLVLDEECYYMLNQQNILRCAKWDETNKRWLSYVLARYFMCNKSIADINVYNDDVYMLLKTGLVFKLDRSGRNFVPDRRFNAYITPAQFEVSRLIYGHMDERIQRAGELKVPAYSGAKVMFQNISVVVSVPWHMEFKINEDKNGHIVIECPALSCATQHGDLLILGYLDGKIEICIPDNLTQKGTCEISTNVKDCADFPTVDDEDPSIVGVEVYEDLYAQILFVATHQAVYRLTLTYPQCVHDQIGLDKEYFCR